MIIPVYKPVGATPLEAIELLRNKGELGAKERASYAGRLDPMAQGVLLVLTGADLDRQKECESLDKAYSVEVVCGIDTDSNDMLGMPARVPFGSLTENALQSALEIFRGEYTTRVPKFSSVKVSGKTMYAHARAGDAVCAPERTTVIHAITDVCVGECRGEVLRTEAVEKINLVAGDFRQQDISRAWRELSVDEEKFPTITFDISCSSGTYIRSLARDLGEALGTSALVRSLVRTRVGEYAVENCLIV